MIDVAGREVKQEKQRCPPPTRAWHHPRPLGIVTCSRVCLGRRPSGWVRQADLVVAENGKNRAEALASVAKGNETVEWACSMPQVMQVGQVAVAAWWEPTDTTPFEENL